MEFKYSTPVPVETVRKSGCFTTLPVRYHRDEELAIRESKRMEADWQNAFGTPPFSQGCQNPAGHLASLSLPECLPDRIGICSYIMDYMLHHDGKSAAEIYRVRKGHAGTNNRSDIADLDLSKVNQIRVHSKRKQFDIAIIRQKKSMLPCPRLSSRTLHTGALPQTLQPKRKSSKRKC